MVFVDLIEKGAYIDNSIIERELKKRWRQLFSGDDIDEIISAIESGKSYITKETVIIKGEGFYKYTIDISPLWTKKKGWDRITIEYLEVIE